LIFVVAQKLIEFIRTQLIGLYGEDIYEWSGKAALKMSVPPQKKVGRDLQKSAE